MKGNFITRFVLLRRLAMAMWHKMDIVRCVDGGLFAFVVDVPQLLSDGNQFRLPITRSDAAFHGLAKGQGDER
ncbi:hypothetical protein [Dechloromonas sp.]|uniref:hypothetical protein n=1 Tax=Dechloromonas sp. TaxID=1917218 RepID=UPI00263F8EBF|nr:hypothetical protein [Dechloromonas sp.]